MSYAVTEWVVKNCQQSGSKKLAMMVLAFRSDDKGECFPSLETLSKEVVVNERQMRVILRDLENSGEIETISGGGRRTNTYRILGYIRDQKSVTNPVQGHYTTGVTDTPSNAQNNLSGGLSTTPITEPLQNPNIPRLTPLGGISQPLWGVNSNPSGGLIATPELKYNKPLSTIEETKDIKSIVPPDGGDTAQKISFDSLSIAPEGKDTNQTPLPVTPTPPAKITTIEGVALTPSTPQPNSVDTCNIQTQPPPVAPPRADRPLSDHQRMTGAIVSAFGWNFKTMTRSNKSLVGKIAKELLEASATPDQIPDLYAFCKGQNWAGGFTPGALSSQWANFCATQSTSSGEIYPVWTPPKGYVGVKFDYPPPLVDPNNPDEDDPYIGLNTAQMRKKFDQLMNKMVDKMTIEETPIPDDDPLKEVLLW